MDISELPKWLNITQQQFDIILSVYALIPTNLLPSPKNISIEYSRFTHKTIQKTNLFTQLKTLSNRGFIVKSGQAEYNINLPALKGTLERVRESKEKELKQFEVLSRNLDTYFKESSGPSEQRVEYLVYGDYWDKVGEKVKYSKELYLVSKFPGVAYTYPVYGKIGRGNYFKTLSKRCFEARDLKVTYMTQLDVSYPYYQALSLYGDTKLAFNETQSMLNTLENQISTYDNLDIRVVDFPFGFDVIIPLVEDVTEFFMYIRDDKESVVGGLQIRSPQTARRAYEHFIREIDNATRLTKANSPKYFARLRKELDELSKKPISELTKDEKYGVGDLTDV